jgi:hypothetical protein
MRKYESLHAFIQSLNKSEKRHFRLFCGQQRGGSNYLLLFDAMNQQEVYDEEAIRSRFSGYTFVKQLHVTKNYLKQLLLKSLRIYHAQLSGKTVMADLLQNIELLFSKEQYNLCKDEITKALKLAKKYELDSYLMEVYHWQRRLIQAQTPFDIPAIEAVIASEEEALQRLNNTFQHKKTNVEVYGKLRSPLGANEELLEAQSPETMEAHVYAYHTSYYNHLRHGEFERAETVMYSLMNYLEKQPDRISEDPALYVSTINNLLGYLIHAKRYEKALKLVEHAKQRYSQWQLGKGPRVLLKQLLRTYNIELEIYRDLGSAVESDVAIQSIERFVLEHEQQAPVEYLILFWYQFAYIYFTNKDYGRALSWINKVLQHDARSARLDLQIYSRVLNLMIHLELKNLFVLGYYIDSTRRFFKKSGVQQVWQKQLLKHFSRIRKMPVYELQAHYLSMYNSFFPKDGEALMSAEELDYINFKSWLEGKLQAAKRH